MIVLSRRVVLAASRAAAGSSHVFRNLYEKNVFTNFQVFAQFVEIFPKSWRSAFGSSHFLYLFVGWAYFVLVGCILPYELVLVQ